MKRSTLIFLASALLIILFTGCSSDKSDFELKKECAQYSEKAQELAQKEEDEYNNYAGSGTITSTGVFYSKALNTCVGISSGNLSYYLGTTKPTQGYSSYSNHDDAYWGNSYAVYFHDLLSEQLIESIHWDESSNAETRSLQEWDDEVENYKKSLGLIE